MSPEQVRGETLDARADIFSFGVVLYEMATGTQPFRGATSGVIVDEIFHKTPASPVRLNPDLPDELARIVNKALEKEKELRYQSAKDLLADLKRLKRDSGSGRAAAAAAIPLRPRRLPGWTLLALGVVVAGLLALGIWYARARLDRPAAKGRAIAVMYFSNLSQDPSLDWLDRGLCEMLTTNLSQVKGMDVLSSERIAGALERTGRKELNPSIAPEVARNAGAAAFVTGALMRIGPDRLRLDVRVQDTAGGQILFSEKVEGEDVRSVFRMVDSLTGRMAEQFLPAATVPEKIPAVEEATTSNLGAYRRYQQGRDLDRRVMFEEARLEYEEAIRLDPQFALAMWELARVYSALGQRRQADALYNKVEAMQSRLPRKNQLALKVLRAYRAGDDEAASQALEALLAEYPREVDARTRFSQLLAGRNQAERALTLLQEGQRLDPNDHVLLNQLCYNYSWVGNLQAALETNDRYRSLLPAEPNPWDTRGDVLYENGRDDDALTAYGKVLELKPDFSNYHTFVKIAFVHMDKKRFSQAETALGEYGRCSKDVGLPVYLAKLEESRGCAERAQELYRQAVLELARAGRLEDAGRALSALARNSYFLGTQAETLSFARRQKLQGEEGASLAVLEASRGDLAAAGREIQAVASTRPWLGPRAFDLSRTSCEMLSALARGDGRAVLNAASRLPDYESPVLLMIRGQAELLVQNYAAAESLFRRAMLGERNLSTPTSPSNRSPLMQMICHFHLGQICEATGRREQALGEYREFLSRFERCQTRLPQVAEARSALKRLGAQ